MNGRKQCIALLGSLSPFLLNYPCNEVRCISRPHPHSPPNHWVVPLATTQDPKPWSSSLPSNVCMLHLIQNIPCNTREQTYSCIWMGKGAAVSLCGGMWYSQQFKNKWRVCTNDSVPRKGESIYNLRWNMTYLCSLHNLLVFCQFQKR